MRTAVKVVAVLAAAFVGGWLLGCVLVPPRDY